MNKKTVKDIDLKGKKVFVDVTSTYQWTKIKTSQTTQE